METLQCDIHMTKEYVIVSKGPRSLWCSRVDGSLKPGSVTPENIQTASFLGKCYGLVGKIQLFSGGDWKLLLIGSAVSVGVLPLCGQIYCIEKLIVIPLTTDPSPEIIGLEQRDPSPAPSRKGSSTKTETGSSTSNSGGGGGVGKQKDGKEKDKLERRLMEALVRMFNDSQSFYFSVDGDITHTQQRKMSRDTNTDLPFWKTVDERFFWNKWMINDLLDITCQRALIEPWILPIIQGYVEIHTLVLHSNNPPDVLSRQTSMRSHRDSEASEDNMPAKMENEIPKLNVVSSNHLLSVQEDREENSRSDASGYESDSDSDSSSSSSSDTSEDEEMKEMKIVGVKVLSNLQTEAQGSSSEGSESEEDNDSRGDSKCNTQKTAAFSMALNPPSMTGRSVRERGRRPLLERLKLQVRRSSSPDTRVNKVDEDTDDGGGRGGGGGGIRMTVRRGLQGMTSVMTGERLTVVSKEREQSGQDIMMMTEGGLNNKEVDDETSQQTADIESDNYSFTLALISRRSIHRAGTRYRRRGVDTQGNVANYVETEMILQAGSHHASYVIVRGSVPVFWTQPGTKYRPPPVIERDEEETQDAFRKHFEQQFSLYNNVAITNLINQSGRESILGKAFEKHVLTLDSAQVTYISFDFHRHFKANPSGALERLITATHNVNKKFKFCWVDTNISTGPLCRQDGVFRVNCMDCLDRTNVVQTAFCREVLQSALQKLGIIPFDEYLSGAMLTTYKIMWANNGDSMSRQYTGTDAMKGDITRYGERKIKGMMKDGYNSAHRYYQNLFRDSYRQVLIDLMQGSQHSEAFSSLPPSRRGMGDADVEEGEEGEVEEEEELWSLDREQAIAEMIQLCREELFPTKTHTVVGWALVEAAGYSFAESSRKEEDCVVLQCREKNQLCVASYNVEDDQVNCFLRIPMEKVEKIVIGPLGTILRSSHKRLHMRLYYTLIDSKQCYFTLKTVNFTSMEEDRDILLGIANTLTNICPSIIVQEQKLTKKKSPTHEGIIYLVMPKDIVNHHEWVNDGKDEDSRLTSQLNTDPVIVEDSDNDEVYDVEDEKKEPASLTLTHSQQPPLLLHGRHRIQRLRSQSFDDIYSNVNNEQDLPLSPPTASNKDSTLQVVMSGHNAGFKLQSSGSDTDTESIPQHGLGVAYNNTILVRSQPEIASVDDATVTHTAMGRLNLLRGKLLQKVRRGQGQKMQSLQVPLKPLPQSEHATSGSGSDTGATDQTVKVNNTSHSQQQQLGHRLLAVGQKFKNSPPSLLRRMGMGGGSGGRGQTIHQALPTITGSEQTGNDRGLDDDDGHNIDSLIEAREKSNSHFITL